MSSFIVTPHRMRKPSSRLQRTRGQPSSSVPEPVSEPVSAPVSAPEYLPRATPEPQSHSHVITIPEMGFVERETYTDDISNLQSIVSNLTEELTKVKNSMSPITGRLGSIEAQSKQNGIGIKVVRGKLAPVSSLQKRLQELEGQIIHFSTRLEELKTANTDASNDKRIEEIGEIARQASNDIESVVKDITPEIGTNKRVNAMEAKLTFATNKFETDIDELKRVQAEMNDRLLSLNDIITSHPLLKVMTSRMDAIESRIDRLMNTLSGLSQAPVIQRRVTGTMSSEDSEHITFGAIQRITSH